MSSSKVAKSYAKALFQLGEERSVDILTYFTKFQEIINSSNELESVLFLEVFTPEEKIAVVKAIFEKQSIDKLVAEFIIFLVNEKRINLFPVIYKDLVVLDDDKKGFLRGVIEGSGDSISKEEEAKIVDFFKRQFGKTPLLEYKNEPKLMAGYRITTDGMQLDATIDNQLNELKKVIIGE